ncbi:unnamed protein product, partial [Ectocarpus sp. 8 AP-2014]
MEEKLSRRPAARIVPYLRASEGGAGTGGHRWRPSRSRRGRATGSMEEQLP